MLGLVDFVIDDSLTVLIASCGGKIRSVDYLIRETSNSVGVGLL